MFVRSLCVLCVCVALVGGAEASTPAVYIHASAAYKRSKEYQLLARYLRYRGFEPTTKDPSKARIALHRTKQMFCIASGARHQRFRGFHQLTSPSSRARALLLYLNIFLSTKGAACPTGPKGRSCRCPSLKKPRRKVRRKVRKRRLRRVVRQRPRALPRPRPRSKRLALTPALRRRPHPQRRRPQPLRRRPKAPRADGLNDDRGLSDIRFDPSPRPKKSAPRKWHGWLGAGSLGGLQLVTPGHLMPGGGVFIEAGYGPFSLMGVFNFHAFTLQVAQRTILLLRPAFFIQWTPAMGMRLLGKPFSIGLQMGLVSEIHIEEPGAQDQEYSGNFAWGFSLGALLAWRFHSSWSLLFQMAGAVYPSAASSFSTDFQGMASMGLRYEFHFF